MIQLGRRISREIRELESAKLKYKDEKGVSMQLESFLQFLEQVQLKVI